LRKPSEHALGFAAAGSINFHVFANAVRLTLRIMATKVKSPSHASIARADELKTELDKLRPLSPEIEGRVLQKLRLWWNYNSNAIEGNKYTLGETEGVLMHGLTAKGKPLKDYLDIEGHEEAVKYLLGLVRQEEVLTEAAVRKLHELLLVRPYEVDAETPDGKPTKKTIQVGVYKSLPNHVRTRTGEIHYYATPTDTPALMEDLIKWYREELNGKMHPIEVATQFHHRFTAIHPFDDGNGRLGRILMNLILMQRTYPPAIVQMSQRDAYLLALQAADNGDINALLEMVGHAVAASLEVYLRAARGEQIHDLQDLSREISLFKQSLRHVPDPIIVSPEIQLPLFKGSIEPFFNQTSAVLLEFKELFKEARVNVNYIWRSGTHGQQAAIDLNLDSTLNLNDIVQHIENGRVLTRAIATFSFERFKRGHLKVFDTSVQIGVSFAEMQYQIWAANTQTGVSLLYNDAFQKDDMDRLSEVAGRHVLNSIRHNLR
jgi:Fic family protein